MIILQSKRGDKLSHLKDMACKLIAYPRNIGKKLVDEPSKNIKAIKSKKSTQGGGAMIDVIEALDKTQK